MGTDDPTAWLVVPEALRVLGEAVPGGWPALMARNHALAVTARRQLCRALGVPPPCPETMLGALASVPLPDAERPVPPRQDPMQTALFERFAIEVPVLAWPASPQRLLRVSCQLYNNESDYARLAGALRTLLSEIGGSQAAVAVVT